MKEWLMGVLSVVIVGAAQAAPPDAQTIKGADGKPLATVVVCSDCQSGSAGKQQCHTGVEDGWLDGQPCGKCLVSANYTWHLLSPNSLLFSGKLTDAEGKPVKDRFVKLYVANGWGVRGRTSDDGVFHLTMGATQQPRAPKPIMIDVGTRVDAPTDDAKSSYALYLLPPAYKACSAQPTPAPSEDHKKKKKP
jgi:hypothetical protein